MCVNGDVGWGLNRGLRGLRRFSQMPCPFVPVRFDDGLLPSREKGRRALFFSGFPPARERRSVLGCVFGSRFLGI